MNISTGIKFLSHVPFSWHFITSLISLLIYVVCIQPWEILSIQDWFLFFYTQIILTINCSCYSCRFRTSYCFITLFIGCIGCILPSFLLFKLLFFYKIIRIFGSVCNIECNLFSIVRSLLLLFFYIILKSFLKNIKLFRNSMLVTINCSFSIHSIFVQAICIEVLPVHDVANFEVVGRKTRKQIDDERTLAFILF